MNIKELYYLVKGNEDKSLFIKVKGKNFLASVDMIEDMNWEGTEKIFRIPFIAYTDKGYCDCEDIITTLNGFVGEEVCKDWNMLECSLLDYMEDWKIDIFPNKSGCDTNIINGYVKDNKFIIEVEVIKNDIYNNLLLHKCYIDYDIQKLMIDLDFMSVDEINEILKTKDDELTFNKLKEFDSFMWNYGGIKSFNKEQYSRIIDYNLDYLMIR